MNVTTSANFGPDASSPPSSWPRPRSCSSGWASPPRSAAMAAYEETGLHPYHFGVLLVLDEGSRETQGSIADALGYDRGQLVGLLGRARGAGAGRAAARPERPPSASRVAHRRRQEGAPPAARARQAARGRLPRPARRDSERAALHALLLRLAEVARAALRAARGLGRRGGLLELVDLDLPHLQHRGHHAL